MSREFSQFDFDYVEVDEEPQEIERPLIDDMHLFRLQNCAISTAKGYADQGFPNVMKRLAALNFVIQVDKGYKITNDGLIYLSKYRKKLETI